MADLEHGIANTTSTVFEIGSVSKQFTAAAVLLLAERRRLSLDNDIRKYFPELSELKWHITIRQLLDHTSGLRDWGEIEEIAGWPRGTREYRHSDVLDIVRRQRALNYAPGEAWSYTNTGYNLAAMLIERISGTSLREFSRKEFFAPLGMNSTEWRDDFRRVVKDRAVAYHKQGAEWRQMMPFEDVYGNGGLLSTVGDLLKWNRNLATRKLHPPIFKLMAEPSTLNNGAPLGYGLGLFLERYAGLPEIAHPGSTAGYVAWLGRIPSKNLSVAVTCNAASADVLMIGHQLAHLFSELPAPGKPVVSKDIQAGLYLNPRDHSTTKIKRSGNNITLDGWPNKLNARAEGNQVIFENPVFGNDVWERVESWKPEGLTAFTGVYTSDEAQTQLRIVVEDGKLVLHNSPHGSFPLQPTCRDDFAGDLGNIHFIRDGSGKIAGLRLSGQRVWDLRFARQEPSPAPRRNSTPGTSGE